MICGFPRGIDWNGCAARDPDRHSMRINDQYRLTFRWEDGHAYEVRVEDYH